MKASELIKEIKTIINLFGDYEILFRDSDRFIYDISEVIIDHSDNKDKVIITSTI